MAYTRMTLEEAEAERPDVDMAKLQSTTEEDIRHYMIEDGEDPDAPLPEFQLVVPIARVRGRLGMSQHAFAALVGVSVEALESWEQGRKRPEPATITLMIILTREPEAALRALRFQVTSSDVAS